MTNINENTFASACYDQNNIRELEDALIRAADVYDMAVWNLTEEEYFASIKLAISAKQSD